MKSLNPQATAIFFRIIDGLQNVGDHRKFDNATGSFMALSVEIIGTAQGGRIVSLAHYYEQQGDLMKDPDVEFWVTTRSVMPLTYQQDGLGIYHRAAWFDDGKLHVNERMQKEITDFCEMWMNNIAEQQGI